MKRMEVSVIRFLTILMILLLVLNLATLVYHSIENARLREAIKTEQALYEEVIKLRERRRSEYESLYSKLLEALEENRRLNTTLRGISGSVVVPCNYTVILERG